MILIEGENLLPVLIDKFFNNNQPQKGNFDSFAAIMGLESNKLMKTQIVPHFMMCYGCAEDCAPSDARCVFCLASFHPKCFTKLGGFKGKMKGTTEQSVCGFCKKKLFDLFDSDKHDWEVYQESLKIERANNTFKVLKPHLADDQVKMIECKCKYFKFASVLAAAEIVE